LKRDCERYNAFVLDGWLVIRFAWEHVMFEPQYVDRVLRGAVALLSGAPLEPAVELHGEPRSA
jgi:very-short-patch-repair endonuclease